MHEHYDVEQYQHFLVVQAQAVLFIVAYHGYIATQSLWQTVVAVVLVAWWAGEISHVAPMIAALVALVLSILISYLTKIQYQYLSYSQLYYFFVQPAGLYYIMRLYVEQTMSPVGIPLAFLLWLLFNGTLWYATSFVQPRLYTYYVTVALPIVSMFFFSYVLDKYPWIPMAATCGVTVIMSAWLLTETVVEKNKRKK